MYVDLLRRNPADADALHYLGVLRMSQRRRVDAVELVRQSLEVAPGNAAAWNSLGNMLVFCEELKAAEVAYGKATAIKPDFAECWFNLANLYRNTAQPEPAVQCYQKVIALKPTFAGAYENIAQLLQRMGRHDLVAQVLRDWAAAEPENPLPRHMLGAYSNGPAPERASPEYVTKLFDRFASHFDESLARIDYAAPRLVMSALGNVVTLGEGKLVVLDAGCGTGLGGPLLRDSAARLVGVDLSGHMLVKARDRGLYDELHMAELVEFMRKRTAAFDLIVCLDTFIYIGRLEEALQAAADALKPGGALAFTVETAPAGSTSNYQLNTQGRYSHDLGYVRSCVTAAQLEIVRLEQVGLRKEMGQEVSGGLVVARKSG
jgi:predicted TPR repeat methyltransferase